MPVWSTPSYEALFVYSVYDTTLNRPAWYTNHDYILINSQTSTRIMVQLFLLHVCRFVFHHEFIAVS